MSSPHTLTFRLPELLANWPWARKANPHHVETMKASSAWIESFHALKPDAQSTFKKCNFGLLAALVWPFADMEQQRIGCDLMNYYFLIDELTDVEDEATVRVIIDSMKDAFGNPDKPRAVGEPILGEVARQFWVNFTNIASNETQERFIRTCTAYFETVVQQAAERSSRQLHTVDSYFQMRRDNVGVKPSFTLIELGMDLHGEVLEHPTIVNLNTWAVDMITLQNDIYSYNVEQARGDDLHNIVTIVMRQFSIDLHGAMRWVADYNQALVTQFLESIHTLPSWGPDVDHQVQRYVDGLGYWVRGNDCWSFEGQRYFGVIGPEIKKHKIVALLPK